MRGWVTGNKKSTIGGLMIMNRIIVALCALASLQLVKGQENCLDAQTNLNSNAICFTAIGTGTDVNTLCMGTCRYLIDAVLSYCNNTVADTYNTLIGTLCDRAATNGTGTGACETAFSSISDNCSNLIISGDNSVCTGICAAQVQDVVIACGATLDPEIKTFVNTSATICSACLAAKSALNASTACLSGMTNNDTNILCFGTCRALIETYNAACGQDSQGLNQLCRLADCTSTISNINSTCLSYLENVDIDVCNETCRAQLQVAASVCTDLDSSPEAAAILNQYDGVCSDACISATSTLNNDAECTSAESDNSTAVCRKTCRTLIMARFDVCPVGDDDRSLYNHTINQLCGSGNMVMTSGIILLFAAMCALVF